MLQTALDFVGWGTLEKQLEGFPEVCLRFFNRAALATDIQLRAMGHKAAVLRRDDCGQASSGHGIAFVNEFVTPSVSAPAPA
jgi:hypothetical protein